jgi:hypothetical protein
MSEKGAKPFVRASGGTPAGMPDYKPINKLPAHEQRALLRRALNPRPVLYQVWVEQIGKGLTPVGPKWEKHRASNLAYAIETQIRLGKERVYSNPTVVIAL